VSSVKVLLLIDPADVTQEREKVLNQTILQHGNFRILRESSSYENCIKLASDHAVHLIVLLSDGPKAPISGLELNRIETFIRRSLTWRCFVVVPSIPGVVDGTTEAGHIMYNSPVTVAFIKEHVSDAYASIPDYEENGNH